MSQVSDPGRDEIMPPEPQEAARTGHMDAAWVLRRISAKKAAERLAGHLRILVEQDPDPEVRHRAGKVITAINQLDQP